MLSFKQYLTEMTGTLPWKEVPEEDKQKAYDLIEAHNNSPSIDPKMNGEYFIGVTGRYQVYYTYWRWRKDIDPRIAMYIKNPIYFRNLTTDLLPSVEKALRLTPKNTRLQIEEDETRTHLIGKPALFTFGKYRGQAMTDVYLENPGYFMWLAKNMDPKYQFNKANQAILVFAKMAEEETIKQNRETSKSQHVGAIGDKMPLLTLKIYSIKEFDGHDFATGKPRKYVQYKFVDENENKFIAYDIQKYFPDVQKDDTIVCRAKIKGQKELMGIKFNMLNYVRPPKEGKVTASKPAAASTYIPPWDVNKIYSKD